MCISLCLQVLMRMFKEPRDPELPGDPGCFFLTDSLHTFSAWRKLYLLTLCLSDTVDINSSPSRRKGRECYMDLQPPFASESGITAESLC
ncbi:unnamed protein product [Gadus morhua 'NCC']